MQMTVKKDDHKIPEHAYQLQPKLIHMLYKHMLLFLMNVICKKKMHTCSNSNKDSSFTNTPDAFENLAENGFHRHNNQL